MFVDKFGIPHFYDPVPDGFQWYANWDEPRSWSPPKKNWSKQRNQDPLDPWSDLHCKPSERSINTKATIADGILTLYGTTPRLYISDPAGVLTLTNVEMTVGFYIVKKLPKGGAYVAARLCGPTNHHLIETKCSAAGDGYSSEVKNSNGTWQQKRENGHAAYSVNNVLKKKGVKAGQWYYLRHIKQNIEDNTAVRVQTFRTTPERVMSNDWDLILEKIDRGDWKFTDKAEYKKVNSCSGFPKIPTSKPQLEPRLAAYLRCDNNEIRYRDFSVTAIAAG